MKVFQRIYKAFSYIFIGFIVILITLTFGMPDFISTSAGSDKYIAVKIGDEILTKSQVARTRENFIRQRFKGQDLPKDFRKRIQEQVLDQMIQNKVSLILMKNIGLYPIDRSKNQVMVEYLKENFSSYFTETSQDFDKFKKEILEENRITYSDLEKDVLDSQAAQDGYQLFNSVQSFSSPEKILRWNVSQIKMSYEIGVIEKKAKESILKKRAVISQKDIQKRFEKNYLSKDPKAKLTRIKKEAIENNLFKEKEKELEKELLKEIKKFAGKEPIRRVASRYGVKINLIRDVALSDSLDSKKPAGTPTLAGLEKSGNFRELLTFSKTNETNVISDKDILYLIRITKKKHPKASVDSTIFQKKEKMNKFIEKNTSELSSIEKNISDRYTSKMTETLTEIQKANIRIKRFL